MCRTTKKILHTARPCTMVSPHAQQCALLGEAVRRWQRQVLMSPQRLTIPLGMRLVVVDQQGLHCRRDTLWHRHLSHPSRPTPGRATRRRRSVSTGRTPGKRVIITEKPSMGCAVAPAALGATTRRIGYLEGASDLVTWCVGHLVELDAPEAYNPAWKHWRLADLPLCPAPFSYHPAESTRDQFNVITQLLGRADVRTVVEAPPTPGGRVS